MKLSFALDWFLEWKTSVWRNRNSNTNRNTLEEAAISHMTSILKRFSFNKYNLRAVVGCADISKWNFRKLKNAKMKLKKKRSTLKSTLWNVILVFPLYSLYASFFWLLQIIKTNMKDSDAKYRMEIYPTKSYWLLVTSLLFKESGKNIPHQLLDVLFLASYEHLKREQQVHCQNHKKCLLYKITFLWTVKHVTIFG